MTLATALSIPSLTPSQQHELAKDHGYALVDELYKAALEVAAGARCETCGHGNCCMIQAAAGSKRTRFGCWAWITLEAHDGH